MTSGPSVRSVAPVTSALLAAVLLLQGGAARAEDDAVQLLPTWKKGDKAVYEMARSRRKTQGDKVPAAATCKAELEIEVLESRDDGFAVTWRTGELIFDTPAAKGAEAIAQRIASPTSGLGVVFELDAHASIQRVRNWKEVQEASKKTVDAICAEMERAGVDSKAIAAARAQAEALCADEASIRSLCTREAQVFFMAIGAELQRDRPVEFDDHLPNPFGGAPFPCKGRFSLAGVDRKSGVATVGFAQTLVPADARRIMEETLKALAQRSGREPPDAEALKSLTIEDSAQFAIELATGWPRTISHKRVTRIGTASQEDAMTFTRKSAPAPVAEFPDDENGRVLKRMAESGDDLSKPRDVDFSFVFPDEEHAADFAEAVKKELSLDAATEKGEESGRWDATVTKRMVPTHDGITQLELLLFALAKLYRGRADGWGCVPVVKAK